MCEPTWKTPQEIDDEKREEVQTSLQFTLAFVVFLFSFLMLCLT